jgi:hypothetical protein
MYAGTCLSEMLISIYHLTEHFKSQAPYISCCQIALFFFFSREFICLVTRTFHTLNFKIANSRSGSVIENDFVFGKNIQSRSEAMLIAKTAEP